MSTIQEHRDEAFAAELRGRLFTPSDDGYAEACKLHNGMHHKHPAEIARCADVADVMSAVDHARQRGMLLAVRSGGHNAAGLGSCDNGLVIDLSPMKGIQVDPEGRTVRVQGGCTWGDVDHATHAFGLATPSGIISSTGVGGLTLGGGIGHLSRKLGLAVDNLLEADVVLANGRLVHASERHHPGLFWALRGGGGNFGVVTSFTFALHDVDTVVAGPTLWPMDRAADVMRFYDDFIATAPEDLGGFFAFLTVPPADPFPAELHMQKMCGIVWCYAGPERDAADVFAPVREQEPALDGTQPMPFPALQSAFDGLYEPGYQWYWRADFVDELSDQAIERHVEHAAAMPTMLSTMHLYPIDGAVHRPAVEDTAFAFRASRWAQVIVGVDPEPALAGQLRDWTVDYFDALHPYSAGGAYVNFMMDEGQERVRATYGPNYDRLTSIKGEYDPGNLFRVNQNIEPPPPE